jgi:hypothetical protein
MVVAVETSACAGYSRFGLPPRLIGSRPRRYRPVGSGWRLIYTGPRRFGPSDQLGSAPCRIASCASCDPLVSRKFAAYTLNDEDIKHVDFVPNRERATLESQEEFREPIEFRNGELCASGRCNIPVRWSDNEVLEFDPASGKLKACWIADN